MKIACCVASVCLFCKFLDRCNAGLRHCDGWKRALFFSIQWKSKELNQVANEERYKVAGLSHELIFHFHCRL